MNDHYVTGHLGATHPGLEAVRIFPGEEGIQAAMNQVLDEGYVPADTYTVKELMDAGEIPVGTYNTGSAIFLGDMFRMALPRELRDLQKTYSDGGRLLFMDRFGFKAPCELDSKSRIVGVRWRS